jgi:hypothetical protein
MKASPKYNEKNLIPMFLKAAAFRNDLVALGFTDNGGAIHSTKRILNILGQHLKYPELRHTNNYKKYHTAQFSVAALKVHKRGEEVLIEHVSPIRDFTRKAIKILDNMTNDNTQIEKLKDFIKKHYPLVLLTPDETRHLNKINRTKMEDDRLERAGITTVFYPNQPTSASLCKVSNYAKQAVCETVTR